MCRRDRCTGAGVAPQKLDVIIGIAKAYSTRVGEGPFPCGLFDEEGDTLREKGGEYGATTGRPRRCGWLDVNVVRHAAMINGLTDLVITKLDILSGFDKIKMCVAYDVDGVRYDYIPSLVMTKSVNPLIIEMCIRDSISPFLFQP